MESQKRPHKNLEVWKKRIEFVQDLYKVTQSFLSTEQYGLVSQIRRAAISVPTNIAEGAARGTDDEFLRFLHISSGSLSELDTLLVLSEELSFISEEMADEIFSKQEKIEVMLNGLIEKKSE